MQFYLVTASENEQCTEKLLTNNYELFHRKHLGQD